MKNSSNSTKPTTRKKSSSKEQPIKDLKTALKQRTQQPTVRSLTLTRTKTATAQGQHTSTKHKPKERALFEQAFSELSPERQEAIRKQVGEVIKPYKKAQADSKGIVHHPTAQILYWVVGLGAIFLAGWGTLKLFHQAAKQYKGIQSTIAA